MSAPLIQELQMQSASALALACAAESAFDAGTDEWAGILHATAERFYSDILTAIARLTDEEADELEPSVTRLESELFRRWPLWKGRSAFASSTRQTVIEIRPRNSLAVIGGGAWSRWPTLRTICQIGRTT